MPSLQALEQFKDSFNNIGGELLTLRELGLPADSLPLPDHEPENGSIPDSSEPSVNTAAENGPSAFDDLDLAELLGTVTVEAPPEETSDAGASASSDILDL